MTETLELDERTKAITESFTMVPMALTLDARINDRAKTVYTVMLNFARRTESCWPGQKRISEMLGVTERTIRTAINDLSEAGHIVVQQRGGGTNIYQLRTLALTEVQSPKQPNLPDFVRSTRKNSSGGNKGVTRKKPSGSTRKNSSCKVDTGEVEEDKQHATAAGAESKPGKKKPPTATVDGHKIKPDEWDLATHLLDRFNGLTGRSWSAKGTTGKPTENVKRIIMRLREYPEIDREAHVEILERAFAYPWWGAKPPSSTGVIYGPNAFPRCVTADAQPKRPEGRRSFDNERPIEDEREKLGW